MEDIIANIETYAYYLAVGVAFVTAYDKRAYSSSKREFEHKLFFSIIVGFFICFVFFNIPFSINIVVDRILIFFASALLGYCSAVVIHWEKMQKFLQKIKIYSTPYQTVWESTINLDRNNHLIMKKGELIYEGIIQSYEEGEKEPWFVLRNYIIKKANDMSIIENHSEDNSELFCIDINNAEYVKFKYYDEKIKESIGTDAIVEKEENGHLSYRLLLQSDEQKG